MAEGLNPEFQQRLMQMIAASGGRLKITSGYRSVARQQQLFDAAVKKYGSVAKARRMVAPPGKSNHNKGLAADLGGDLEWAHQNAARFGLYFPMGWEKWHVELQGTRGTAGHTTAPADGATEGPGNPQAMTDLTAPDPHKPETQLANFMSVLATGGDAQMGSY